MCPMLDWPRSSFESLAITRSSWSTASMKSRYLSIYPSIHLSIYDRSHGYHPTSDHQALVRVSSFVHVSTQLSFGDIYLYQSVGCDSTWLLKHYDDDDDYSHSQPHTRTTQTRTHFSRHSFIHSFDRMIRSSINHGNHGSFEPCTILDICVYISISSRLDGIMMNTLSLKCSNYRSYGTVRITNINTTTSTIRPTSSHESRFQAILPSTVTYQSINRLFIRCILPTSLD